MCGRFNQKLSPAQWANVFETLRMPKADYDSQSLRFNTAPMQDAAVVRSTQQGPELALQQWKLIPAWSKTRDAKFNTINAKVETIETSGTYRIPFRSRRCLIPVAGFFEWPTPGSSEFDDRKPYYITFPEDRPMIFAGIWDRWTKAELSIESFSIITVPANPMMSSFHHRMPAILNPDCCHRWLDHDIEDQQILKSLLQPRAEDDLQKYRVSKYVNNWRNENADCISPLHNA